ncbi:MAG TPA: FAD:protein FMN transferase [Candidatus Limnocylindria bacterium]
MRRTEEIMGMAITIDVRDGAAGIEEAFAELRRIDAVFSPFAPESAVSRINDGSLRIDDASAEVQDVLARCEGYEAATGGFFSAWRGAVLDPSGYVKGWAIARACAILDTHGHRAYFVDAGGDVRTRGSSATGEPWRIGIRHPVERGSVVRVVLGRDLAVATSGTYEKGAHIYDPHTGAPTDELMSLTVVGPSIVEADVQATAAFAMGARAIDYLEDLPGYEAYAIGPDLRATWTSGFDALCAVS